ncbi:hypothetical protein JCM16303_006102 [Sporobolomyces ruberrimus]
MSFKYNAPRRRQTLPYPSPVSSLDSVSSCSTFSSSDSDSYSPTSPSFSHEFTFEPESTTNGPLDCSIPPPGAQFFPQRVHRVPEKMSKKEEWTIWYSATFATNLLEPWEKVLIHLLFLSIIALSYLALHRLLSLSNLAQFGSRVSFYATGGSDNGKPFHSSL